MNKVVAAICILITSVLAFALVMVMIAGISGNTFFNWGGTNLNWDFFSGGESVMVKEESISLSDCSDFILNTSSHKIYVTSTSGDKMTVRQYGSSDLSGDELFSINKDQGKVSVEIRDRRLRISFFSWRNDYFEIAIPSSWMGNVSLKTSSGGIRIEDSFNWGEISLNCTSGGINVASALQGTSVSIRSSSGGIRLHDDLRADKLDVGVTSGGMKAEYVEAKSINMESSSGGITINGAMKTDDLYLRVTSGGIKTDVIDAGNFVIETSSGGAKITELIGQGNVKCTSGGIVIDMLRPSGNVELRSSSGGITCSVPSELSHFVNTRATSGGVRLNEV